MKSTRSGHTWAHVICALWIPEISFADPVRMEPIAKVELMLILMECASPQNQVPASCTSPHYFSSHETTLRVKVGTVLHSDPLCNDYY